MTTFADIDVRMNKTLQWAMETQKLTENRGLSPIIAKTNRKPWSVPYYCYYYLLLIKGDQSK